MKFSKSKRDIVPKQEVRVANSAYAGMLFKRVFSIVGLVVLSLFIIYLCFAATIMRVIPTVSGSGLVPVKENTFLGGQIPKDTLLLVDRESEKPSDTFSRLKQAFIPTSTAAVISIEAGPYGKLKWIESGLLTVDGELTDTYMKVQPESDNLRSEYLGICVSGACEEGEGVIVSKENIYGVVLSDLNANDSEEVE